MKWETKCEEREERRGVNEMEGVTKKRKQRQSGNSYG